LGLLGGEDPFKSVKQFFGAEPVLAVLDNFEHLANDAPLLAELLRDCPGLRLLVTSRVALHLSVEHEYPLQPLALEDAIELFSERSHAVRADFEADLTILAAICSRLDFLPLAIELAAARSRLLSPSELLDRLSSSLEFLIGGPRDLDRRQQTLRATIEWSYNLLEPAERELLTRLAVFAGGFTLTAAEQVCHATLNQLESLADKSLIVRREAAGEARFWLLETIREYALERLDAEHGVEQACEEYSAYYLAFARERVAEVDRGEVDALHALERELDNFLAAFAWSHSPDHVPVPVDDGSCDHLIGKVIPTIRLESSRGPLDLADLASELLVLYLYPGTTRPGRPPLPGLYQIPGGRGCTAQARAFRDHAAELQALGAQIAGLSSQTLDEQLELAERARMPFPIMADPERQLEQALQLPTLQVAGKTLYRRTTLVAKNKTIIKTFYPVFPPDRNAEQVITWLTDTIAQRAR
jgi:predicted ATPase/peroxiredoxin